MATVDGRRSGDGRFEKRQDEGVDEAEGADDADEGDAVAEGDEVEDEELVPIEPASFAAAELDGALDLKQPEVRLPVDDSGECLLGLGKLLAFLGVATGVLGVAMSFAGGGGVDQETLAIFGALLGASLVAMLALRSADCAFLIDNRAGNLDYERRWLGMTKRYTVAKLPDVKRVVVSRSRGPKGRYVDFNVDVRSEDDESTVATCRDDEARATRVAAALARHLKVPCGKIKEEE